MPTSANIQNPLLIMPLRAIGALRLLKRRWLNSFYHGETVITFHSKRKQLFAGMPVCDVWP
jgi:hypothetical protein